MIQELAASKNKGGDIKEQTQELVSPKNKWGILDGRDKGMCFYRAIRYNFLEENNEYRKDMHPL